MSPTVVIGGTGFLGSRLVEQLALDTRVVVISRSGRWPWGARPIGAGGIPCDISDRNSAPTLYEAFRDARRVVNLAGSLWRKVTPVGRYRGVHVEGTRLVLDALHAAAGESGPIRLVHVSTTGVLGPTGPDPRGEDEPPAPSNEYERTKLEGERLALAARHPGLEVVVLRPGLVYGPRDLHLLPLFRAIRRGWFRPISRGRARWQPVYVDDVARGIAMALEAPNIDGAVIHLAGAERLTVAQFTERIAAVMGRRPPRASIPYPVAWTAGAVLESLAAPLRRDPPLSRARVRTLTEDRVYEIAAARKSLGWRPEIMLEEGLDETVRWYRAQNLLR